MVHDLATGRYIHKCSPVLIVGPSGVGKSHLAQALGHCAIRQGVDVMFTSCSALWDQAFPNNPLLASATLDRLRHNAYCLTLNGESYRAPRPLNTGSAKPRKTAP
ncbi:MAG: hypothetical protein EBW84_08575 [Betaproteobacteria bacterium]|nr:hypothetical protein [Betaproteobacteria bacterium]